jgi:hypothetical protein
MEDNAYIGSAIAGALYIAAGIRLARLRGRTGELPELVLSVCFLLWGVSYLLYAVPSALGNESLINPFFFPANILSDAGALACSVFTWKVFRASEKWAPLFVAGIALCLVAGIGASAWAGEWEGSPPLTSAWYWFEWAGATLPCLWIGVEAFIQFRKASRRQRLGLCDALVRNRYLLWGIVGAFWVTLQFIFIFQDIAWARTHQWPAYSDTLVGILEIISIGTVWLVFFPPAAYRRWVESASPAEMLADG